MAAERFKVTVKPKGYGRNTTKLSFLMVLLALTGLATLLLTTSFFLSPFEDGARGANKGHTPAHNFESQLSTPAMTRTTEQAREAYGQLPMSFEANRGQAGESVNFVARGAGYTLALSPTEATFLLRSAESGLRNVTNDASPISPDQINGDSLLANPKSEIRNPQSTALRMNLVGANRSAAVAGVDELEGKVNYLIGKDPAKWRTDVPTFGRVRYTEVYPGIDVVYYGNQRSLEYDFVVAPGRDTRTIALRFSGVQKVEVEAATGDLLLRVGEETVRQHAPVTYQETAGGERRAVESRYAVKEDGKVSFEVGEYDRSLALVIDPTLVYSTFFGGSAIEESPLIAVDSAGNAYVTGITLSTDFPTSVGAFDTTHNGGVRDVFVMKFNSTGSGLIYSTYLGGNSIDRGLGIAVDPAGNAYVTGQTQSLDFPTTPGAFDTTSFAANDISCFVTKLNANGSGLLYSTWLKGPQHQPEGLSRGTDIAVDSSGNAYVVGVSDLSEFPTTAGAFNRTHAGNLDLFVTKLNPTGSSLVYSTFFGGGSNDSSAGIALDAAGNVFVTGFTESDSLPTTPGAFDTTDNGGDFDGFVAKFNAGGSGLLYSTYLGGSEIDAGGDIAVDADGNAYVTGVTQSTDFPTTCGGAFDTTLSGFEDAFVSKLNSTGTALVYSTYLGGSGDTSSAVDTGRGIAVDSDGNAYVTGVTTSSDFPVTSGALDTTFNGQSDAFVTKINKLGTGLVHSTFLGGASADLGTDIALDAASDIYITGDTLSSDFPTTPGAFDTAINGTPRDGFISKINDTTTVVPAPITSCATPTPTPTPSPSPSPTPVAASVQFSAETFNVTEGCVPATLTITLTGTPSGTVAVDYTVNEGTAKQKTDFTYVAGTVLPQSSATSDKPGPFVSSDFITNNSISGSIIFAEGETEKEITILISEDGFAEGTENLSARLSNPRGANLGSPATTTLNINDNETVNSTTNPIDDAPTYVCQLYHDFLHRQPDPSGQTFWAAEITQCGANQACIAERRHNVAAAFFLSIEFQQTGYFVYRAYEAGLDRRPQYEEFMRAFNAIGLGVEVLIGDWEQRLAAQRRAFAELMVQTDAFRTLFPDAMTAEQFADKLFANAGATPTAAERAAVVSAYGVGNTSGRAAALTAALDSGSVNNNLYNSGFVLVEYFGFMRRDPDDAPDTNLDGFNFWLQKMDTHTPAGEDARIEATAFARIKRAEMVRAFILSTEYRGRFGP